MLPLLTPSEPTPQKVTFIDTPGQEIFYRMRDYGAAIADLALLVIAADDGVSDSVPCYDGD